MSATPGLQFALEIHPPEWAFPAGKTWIGGWLFAGRDRSVTDLRAWVDGRAFLAIHGLPKPALDPQLLGRAGPPYSGFVLLLEPHRGASLLRLEFRDTAGGWTEFFRTPIRVADDAPGCPPPRPLAATLADAVPALLKLHARQPTQPLAGLADEIIAATVATPLDALPVPPFQGALEEPRETGWLRYGRLSVNGWLAHRTARITRITALADAVQESTLRAGLPRPDIAAIFPDLPRIGQSEFRGHVDLPATLSAPVLVKVFAELDNGEKHLAFAQRFMPRVIAGADSPLPSFSRRTFGRVVWALLGSARRHGLPRGSTGELLAALRGAWAAYRAEAPSPVGHRLVPGAPPLRGDSARPLRVLVATHNLNFEGAPWFIFELARYLAAQPGASVRVVSPQDGPMREVFVRASMPVDVVDVSAALTAESPAAFQSALSRAFRPDWSEIDLLIGNTMVTFWAVLAAQAAGKPALLYVHESSPVRRFFRPLLPASLFPLVEDAFRATTNVVFTADSSRLVFDYLNERDHFRLLPSWVDAARVDAFASTHATADLRCKHGLDPRAVLLVNIGSVCERKGQHIFVRTAELLRDELRHTYPDRPIQFVMVGARPGPYLDILRSEVDLHGLDNVVFVPETGEIFDFYQLADIFVCTSFEESFPRVLLESAAFARPIVSTNVNGIAEMFGPDEAWLTPPGDRYQLAEAIKQALAAHFAGDRTKATRAREAVLRRYHQDASLPGHLAVAQSAVAGN